MPYKARSARDPFSFSRRGTTVINPYVVVPAVADDEIGTAWDERLGRPAPTPVQDDQPSTARELENLLARFFAPGRRDAA